MLRRLTTSALLLIAVAAMTLAMPNDAAAAVNITIDDGAGFTNSRSIDLTSVPDGTTPMSSMRFGLLARSDASGATHWTSWGPYRRDVTLRLPAADDYYHVTGEYRDADGSVHASSALIGLDTLPPLAGIFAIEFPRRGYVPWYFDEWVNEGTASFWMKVQDHVLSPCQSGFAGYSHVLDEVQGTAPPRQIMTRDWDGITLTGLPNGKLWLHVAAVDRAGNWSDPLETTVWIDRARPVIAIAVPAAGARYLKGQPVRAAWKVRDAHSGLATQSATVVDGGRLATSRFGTRSVTVKATDVAGNKASTRVAYSVPFATRGFTTLARDGSTVVNHGRLPLRFTLTNAAGKPVTGARPVLRLATRLEDGWSEEFAPVSATAPADRTVFRYDAKRRQYVYQLDTRGLEPNTAFRLRVDLGRGAQFSARFSTGSGS
jgi:hypothetical protein